MANLAIKGHPTRGRDIIQLLEMLGGRNSNNCTGQYINRIYFINKYGYIESTDDIKLQLYCATYNLEEFEEKFPYKVGDKILYKVYGIYSKIKSMLWNKEKEQVFYRLESNKLFVATVDELNQYKEETMEGTIKIDIPKGYEFFGIDDDNKIVLAEKQPQYPKDYEECCEVLMGKTDFQDFELVLTKLSTNINEENSISPEPPYITSINNLYKLLICRGAYWKIAGEQMGLSKPWESDFTNNDEERYGIYTLANKVEKDFCGVGDVNMILVFPTEEMRDTFYNNFKELIEQCKELL